MLTTFSSLIYVTKQHIPSSTVAEFAVLLISSVTGWSLSIGAIVGCFSAIPIKVSHIVVISCDRPMNSLRNRNTIWKSLPISRILIMVISNSFEHRRMYNFDFHRNPIRSKSAATILVTVITSLESDSLPRYITLAAFGASNTSLCDDEEPLI